MPRPVNGATRSAETDARILSALRAGNTRTAAAGYAGFTYQSLYNWFNADEEFAAQVLQAESHAEVQFVAIIAKAAQEGDWRASESWLKRRRRDEWGDNLSLRNLTDEELIALTTGGAAGDAAAGDTPQPGGAGG